MKKRSKNLYFSNRSDKPKKRMDPLVIRSVTIISSVLILSVVIAVITGTLLGKKSEQIPETESQTGDERPERNLRVPEVQALCYPATVPFQNIEEGSTLSVTVKNGQGTILFRSDVARSLGLQDDETGFRPSELVDAAHASGVRMSFCFYFSCFGIQDENTRKSVESFEKSLIWELISAHPDELILLGLPFDADGVSDSKRVLEEIIDKANDTAIGLTCPYDALQNNATDLLNLYSVSDFMLLDLNDCSGPKEQYVQNGEDSFVLTPNPNSAYQVYKTNYQTIVSCGMRILLSENMEEDLSDLISLGMSNYQLTDCFQS